MKNNKANTKLKNNDQESSDFRHDFFGIIFAIEGVLENYFFYLKQKGKEDREAVLQKAHYALEKTKQNIEKVKVLSRKLFDLAQPSNVRGRGSLLSLRIVWRRAICEVRKRGVLNSIEVLEKIPAKFPKLYFNEESLVEIFYILIENAARALGGNGKISIRASLVYESEKEMSAHVKIEDQGRGISPLHFPRLFRPFGTTHIDKGGNGLGLYMAKELIRQGGGRIYLNSFPGHGTIVNLVFPLKPSS